MHLKDMSRALYQSLPKNPEGSEEHTSELQSLTNLVCRLLLEKKNNLFFYFFTPLTTYPIRVIQITKISI